MIKLLRHAGAVLVVLTACLQAHQPWLVKAETVLIREPEVSKAYYGELVGSPQPYVLDAADSFSLYVSILSPAIPGADRDFSVEVSRSGDSGPVLVARLDGPAVEWRDFHEPVANDHYWMGPEFRSRAGPGRYLIRVFSPDNRGKYALAVGEQESFPPAEIARAYGVLPRLKREFFGKPAASLLFSASGAAAVVTVGAVAGVVVLVACLVRR